MTKSKVFFNEKTQTVQFFIYFENCRYKQLIINNYELYIKPNFKQTIINFDKKGFLCSILEYDLITRIKIKKIEKYSKNQFKIFYYTLLDGAFIFADFVDLNDYLKENSFRYFYTMEDFYIKYGEF